MMKKLFFFFMLFPVLAFADTSKGEKLLNRLWKDISRGNIKKIEHYTSKHFQSVCDHGAFNKPQMIDFLKHLKLHSYKISDLEVTEGEKVITLAYKVFTCASMQGLKDVEGEHGENSVTRRLDVWKKCGDTWKWVAEADLPLCEFNSGEE